MASDLRRVIMKNIHPGKGTLDKRGGGGVGEAERGRLGVGGEYVVQHGASGHVLGREQSEGTGRVSGSKSAELIKQ